MKSILLIIACIGVIILAIKKWNIVQREKNAQLRPAHSDIVKDYFFLPEEVSILGPL